MAEGNEEVRKGFHLSLYRRVLTDPSRKACPNDNASIIHFIRALLHLAVVVTIIVAVELVIRWNHISDAYTLATSAQLFPVLLSICLLIRVIWHRLKQSQDKEDTDTCSTCSSVDGQRPRRDGWPAPGPVPRVWIEDNA